MTQADVQMTDDAPDDAVQEPIIEEVQDEPMEGVPPITELNPPEVEVKEEKPSLPQNETTFTWRIPRFSQFEKERVLSDTFTAGGYPWNVLMFPRGNRDVLGTNVSLYLNVADTDTAPVGWSRRAKFKLSLVNQLDPEHSVTRDAEHTFQSNAIDWGFTSFVALRDLMDPKKGLCVDDTIEIKAWVCVERTDCLNYDSKRETGFVGLKNQGATCYMNSLLQFLFNINHFRKAVYHMPTTEEDDPTKSIPLALQSLFYKLQFGDASVSTKDLTKSFGWDTYDAFMQHDVQELNRVLQEKLEDKMKGTKVEGTIARLFEGHMHMFIECINVDYKSTRRESFMDLQLDVKGCKSIYDSFDKYCEVEVMDGQNQYKTDDHGMQDARKGVLFDEFPPVLQLQLKRFEYDFQRDIMVKINDRYEFPDELDLDVGDGKYLSENADRSVRNLYKLHSVLVHSGGVHGGHYYAFIEPDGKQWLKFDDERVSLEDPKKALNEQYGGEDENSPPGTGFNTFRFTKFSNAYMLVYVRKSDWNQIMCSVDKSEIQEHVQARLEAEKEEKERRKREKAEAHLYTIMRLVQDDDLREQIGNTHWFDLADMEKVKQVRVKKQALFREFREQAAQELDLSVDQLRFWTFAKRQNSTMRPSRMILETEDNLRVTDVRELAPAGGHTRLGPTPPVCLFVEMPVPPQAGLPAVSKNNILLFLKLYNPKDQSLRYVGRVFAPKTVKLQDIEKLLCQRAGLQPDTPLLVFEEIKFEPQVMCEHLNPGATLANQQLEDGDILCYQERPTEEELESLQYPTVRDFLGWVKHRTSVTFRTLDQPREPGLTLELRRDLEYEGVAEALTAALQRLGEAEKLGLDDPQKLRFTPQQPFANTPKQQPYRWRGFDTLQNALGQAQSTVDSLFYEVLDIPLQELEQLKTLKVHYYGDNVEQLSVHDVRLPKDSTVGDVLEALRQQLPEETRPRELRMLEVFYSKIYKVFNADDKTDTIDDRYWTVRAEAVPEEELNAPESSRKIYVAHVHPEQPTQVFGNPFILLVGEDETMAQIKPRIQKKLRVKDEEFAKWKFTFHANLRGPEYLDDSGVLAARFARQGPMHVANQEISFLGLEHVDTGPKRPHHNANRFSQYERPVKIYN